MSAIEITNMSKHFKEFSLQDVTIHLPDGYIMGLIGANGAGKTTLIKIIMGLYVYQSGFVKIMGLDPIKDGRVLRNKIGFIFDDPKYYDFKLGKVKKIIAPFYSNWDDSAFKTYLEKFELSQNMRFTKLSRGMKLKFSLAIALSHNAELLVLDEPTSGLDPIFRVEFLRILQEVINQGTCSILFSSHITDDVEKIADYVTYIKKGHVRFSEDKNEIMSRYLLIKGEEDSIPDSIADIMVAGTVTPYYYEALVPRNHGLDKIWKSEEPPKLEQIMLYHEMRGD
ncbi:MAG: ABC transporter ATP-binding protein [Bacillota bacterium]|nr:ABC transporter ATP-binding protein [Bacillota bacterium]